MAGTIDLVMVYSRAAILVIAALSGTMSIFLGWKLYRESLPSSVEGQAAFEKWSVKLSSAGPGVFFAAFGMWLLVHIVDQQMKQIDEDTTPPTAKTNFGIPQNYYSTEPARLLFAADVTQTTTKTPACAGNAVIAAQSVCLAHHRIRVLSNGDDLTPDEFSADLDQAATFLRRLAAANPSGVTASEQQQILRLVTTFSAVRHEN